MFSQSTSQFMRSNADLPSTVPHIYPVVITCPYTVVTGDIAGSWREGGREGGEGRGGEGGREGRVGEGKEGVSECYCMVPQMDLPMVDIEAPLERAQ